MKRQQTLLRAGAEITSHSLLRIFVVCRETPTKAYREYSFLGASKAGGEKTCKEWEAISAPTLKDVANAHKINQIWSAASIAAFKYRTLSVTGKDIINAVSDAV